MYGQFVYGIVAGHGISLNQPSIILINMSFL